MAKVQKTNNMERRSKGSTFKMKAGKEGPMKRNFGVSPVKDRPTTVKEKIKAAGGTAADVFTSSEPITAISKIGETYKLNKAYQRYLSDKKKKEQK